MDKKAISTSALKNLELDLEVKEAKIKELKVQIQDKEIEHIQEQNLFKDELELMRDKNNKLMQAESTLEVFRERLQELPQLKAKLKQAL